MAKQYEANEDWIKRDGGRIPTKGAAAAERASAGLGTLNDDAALEMYELPPRSARFKPGADEPTKAPSSSA